jgi:putative phosphoribosyl transferase
MFRDRKDAGEHLARALERYRNKRVIVLAIPRGGVQVGYEVAQYLNAELAIVVTRKLPFPDEPEAGFGAIAEDGSTYLSPYLSQWVSEGVVQRIKEEQQAEIHRRISVLRKGQPLPEMRGKTVILVDDGIAVGSTMRATIALCKNQGAEKIVVAVPVTGKRTAQTMSTLVDDTIVLETPPSFHAVAQVYENWYDVSDQEVLAIMEKYRRESTRIHQGREIDANQH